MSRHNQKMDYWGGSIPGSYKCQCGIIGDCKDPTKWCNCDSGKLLETKFINYLNLRVHINKLVHF